MLFFLLFNDIFSNGIIYKVAICYIPSVLVSSHVWSDF